MDDKTAFAIHAGLFECKGLPFALPNSPAIFERLMEAVLSGLQWEKCLVSRRHNYPVQHLRKP